MPTFLIFGILGDFRIGLKITNCRKSLCVCFLETQDRNIYISICQIRGPNSLKNDLVYHVNGSKP